jgi:ligand-binding sensor domain-containing protein
MKNLFLYSSILFILISCNTPKVESTISEPEKTTPIITRINNEPAPPPIVIRSSPSKISSSILDTNQVSQYIRKIFQDKNGNLWFGTVGEGVVKYDVKSLTYYTTQEGLSGNNIQGIQEDRSGNMWFGTTGGVSKYEPSRLLSAGSRTFANFPETKTVLSLLVDNYDNVWAGTYDGIYRYTENAFEGGKAGFVNFTSIPTGEINDIKEDRTGNIWFATSNSGIYKFDGRGVQNYNVKDGLLDNHVNNILEDTKGNIWLATKKGLSCYNTVTGFVNYSSKENLALNGAFRLYQDKQGTIWIGCFGHVYKYDGISFKGYNEKDGINPTLQSVYQDKAGHLWFGAGSGLFLYKDDKFVNVTKKGPWPL